MADAKQERATTTVRCRHPGGLELRLFAPGPDGMGGMFATGPAVRVDGPGPHDGGQQVETTIDAEFASAWFQQNAHSPLVEGGLVELAPQKE